MRALSQSALRLYRAQRSSTCGLIQSRMLSSDTMMKYNFETLAVSRPKDFVLQVEINRPEKRNAMNAAFWKEMVECFQQASDDPDCRVVVVSGAGKMFTAGLDLMEFASIIPQGGDVGRKAFHISKVARHLQNSFLAIEKCQKPVVAAVHNACIGGGVDMVTACDVRYCSQDAWFQVKEVELGLAADLGTLQRLPKVLGNDSLARELCLTGRKMASDEALSCGLVSRVCSDRETTLSAAIDTAELIASRSPIAVQTTKLSLNYSRDHSVQDGLDHVLAMNQGMLQSEDLMTSAMAMMEKKTPTFSKL